jgi:Interferon-related developmental regulator (IFRD)
MYENASSRVKRTIEDSSSMKIKAAAINSLALLAFYCSVEDDELLKVMDFYLDIISSDGACIDAEDAPGPVVAAIQSFSLLATVIEDLSRESSDAVEILLGQLDSTDAAVKVAAGEAIALLYEKSYTAPELDEKIPDSTKDPRLVIRDDRDRALLIRRYLAFSDHNRLVAKLSQMKQHKDRRLNKKTRKTAKGSVRDVLSSIENPAYGPRYSTAINDETDREYGNRLKVKVGGDSTMVIDKWWKLARLLVIKRVLLNGFMIHYQSNPLLFEALPVMVS